MHRKKDETPAHTPDDGIVTGSQANPQIGYETTDGSVSGVLIFLTSLAAFLLVFFVFCFGMGKVINNALVKQDGPPTKWNQIAAVPHKRGKSLQSTAAMEQQQLQLMTQRFPTPRLQMDDGNQDLADMHQREDLLLDHYSWVNKHQGTVRIPIDTAMEMIVARGLPVAPKPATDAASDAMENAQDQTHAITPPLTNGFARTTYEQEQEVTESVKSHSNLPNQMSSTKGRTSPATSAKAQAGGSQ